MNRFLYKLGAQSMITAVMLLLVLSPYQALLAQAQTTVPAGIDPNANTSQSFTGGSFPATTPTTPTNVNAVTPSTNGPTTAGTITTAQPAAPAAAATAAAQTAAAAPKDDIGCSLSNVALCLSNVVYVFTVGIGSAFAYTAAYFFDVAIQLSLNGTAYALTFVSTGWTTARDLANMAFLFILLFIAFQILFSADTANTQQILASVIVIALLVNFSFFFSRLVIDAGNVLSIEFYNSIPAGPISASNTIGASAVTAATNAVTSSSSFSSAKDLTAAIMNMLQLQGLFNTTSFNAFAGNSQNGFLVILLTLCTLYIAAAMMMWALAVTFVSVGIKFLIRIVVLWFLIIFSPLAFVARAIPQFRGYFDRWLKELVRHAFYPVAFLFIFLILVNFTNSMSCVANAQGLTSGAPACTGLIDGVFTGVSNAGAVSPNFILQLGVALANVGLRLGFVLAILFMGLKASESFSVMGASYANSAGNWVGGKFKQATFGSAGYLSSTLGRNTIGRAGSAAAQSSWLRASAANNVLSRVAWRGAGALGRQSFNTSGALNKVGIKAPGASFGKGGYTGSFNTRVKEREDEAKLLKQATETQTNNAIAGVISNLTPEQKQKLIDAADNFASTKEDQTNGDATPADVKAAKKLYNDTIKELGLNDKIKDAKAAIGSGNAKQYADSISTKNFKNLRGLVHPADAEAAFKIRGAKTDGDRVKNILSKLGFKPTPESTAPGKQASNDNDQGPDKTPPTNTPGKGPKGGNDNNPTPTPPATSSAAAGNDNSIAAKGGTWSIASANEKYKEDEKVKLMRKQLNATENISKVLSRGLSSIQAATNANHIDQHELTNQITNAAKTIGKNTPLSNTIPSVSRAAPAPANDNFNIPSASNDNVKPANDNITMNNPSSKDEGVDEHKAA